MFNCHHQDLLTQFFLLTLENLRLNQTLGKKIQLEQQKSQDTIRFLTSEKESKMRMQMIRKQQKISELNLYVRQLHNQNEEISLKLESTQHKYRTLQENYLKQIREYKKKIMDNNSMSYLSEQKNNMMQNLALETAKLDKRHNQDHNYHIKVLQRQKEQLNSQIERLTKVTIKQLQADIETLNRANQTYMNSITNYRSQQNKYLNQKTKYEEKINKYCEKLSTFQAQKDQYSLQIDLLRHENSNLRQKIQKNERSNKNQLQKMVKLNSQLSFQIKKMKQKQEQLQKLRQKYHTCCQQLQKKSLKLKDYDEQYKIYVNKMTLFSNQVVQLKQDNLKLKQQYQNELNQQKRKSNDARQKISEQNKFYNEKIMNQFQLKVKTIENEYNLQKIKEIKSLESQIQCLKEQLQNGLSQQEEKYQKVEKQRDQALRQWDQILAEMGKQKKIMKSLEQQLQIYRKNDIVKAISPRYNWQPAKTQADPYLDMMNKISQYKNQRSETNGVKKSEYKLDLYENILDKSQVVSNEQDSQSYRGKRNNQHKEEELVSVRFKTESNNEQIDSKRHNEVQLQNFSFSTNRNKYQPPQNMKMINQEKKQKNCCQQCETNKNKKSASVSSSRNQKQQAKYMLLINDMRPGASRDSRSVKREREIYEAQRFHLQNRLSLNQKYKSQQLQKPSLPLRRREQTFKKYQSIRTKTQQSFLTGCSEKQFFQQNQISQYKTKTDKFAGTNMTEHRDHYQRSLSYDRKSNKSTSVDNRITKQDQHIMKRSSLKKIDHDRKLEEIQQYLSFNVKDLKDQRVMKRSFSDRGFKQNQVPQLQRVKTFGKQTQNEQKQILMEKINKISSWRGQNQVGKHTKWFNFHKKTAAPLGRMSRKTQKQNINDIIHKKCQYISQK